VPGIGQTKAETILKHRAKIKSRDDIPIVVKGIGAKIMTQASGFLYISEAVRTMF
jgi:transcriptional accessory protein Tex/SPT6